MLEIEDFSNSHCKLSTLATAAANNECTFTGLQGDTDKHSNFTIVLTCTFPSVFCI